MARGGAFVGVYSDYGEMTAIPLHLPEVPNVDYTDSQLDEAEALELERRKQAVIAQRNALRFGINRADPKGWRNHEDKEWSRYRQQQKEAERREEVAALVKADRAPAPQLPATPSTQERQRRKFAWKASGMLKAYRKERQQQGEDDSQAE